MPTPEQLQAENERLKAELELLKAHAAKPSLFKRMQQEVFKPIAALLSFLLNLLKSFLDGRIFLGVVLAVGLAGFGYFIYQYGSLSSFISAAALLVFVAWVFYMFKERTFQQQQAQFQEQLQQYSTPTDTPPLPLRFLQLLRSKDPIQQQQQAQQIRDQLQPYLLNGIQLIKAYATKFLAFNSFLSLFTLLTSIAIGVIAFLQLEKFDRQNNLFEGQNELFKGQNDLFKDQNKRVTEQTALMRSQDSLLRMQNEFLRQQLGQIETQNQYIKRQIAQADIQNRLVEQQNVKIEHQNKRLDQQTNLQEADRRSSLVFLFSNIMDAIDRELKDSTNKQRTLSKPLIGRIIALSARLKPYKYLTAGDTLTTTPLSPERGQLLINLVESDLDSVTYISIFKKANFEAADLISADLREAKLNYAKLIGADLISADLRGADLRGADLSGADLSDADLSSAYLNYADLSNADLSDADLSDADLRDAYLRAADLRDAYLRGANLINANLSDADLSDADLRAAYLIYADLINANLRAADLSDADLRAADLIYADLRGAYLIGANLINANLIRADLSSAKLNGVSLSEAKTNSLNFLTELEQDNVVGSKALQEKYYVDSTLHTDFWGNYYLIKSKQK